MEHRHVGHQKLAIFPEPIWVLAAVELDNLVEARRVQQKHKDLLPLVLLGQCFCQLKLLQRGAVFEQVASELHKDVSIPLRNVGQAAH